MEEKAESSRRKTRVVWRRPLLKVSASAGKAATCLSSFLAALNDRWPLQMIRDDFKRRIQQLGTADLWTGSRRQTQVGRVVCGECVACIRPGDK